MFRGFILLTFLLVTVAPAAQASAAAGFIHGTVTWPDGETLTGFIRWENEEAFWDDLFHCGYRENPWSPYIDADQLRAQRRKEYYQSHGLIDRIIYSFDKDDDDPLGWRLFLIRYGDIVNIEINDGEDDFVTTSDGSRHRIGGYGNDSGADLLVYSGTEEPTEIDWNDLVGIEFFAAPTDAVPYGERLYGLVESTAGSYQGFIQWDVTECLSIDTLDGRLDGKNHDYLMGEIRSIARAPRGNASDIVLKDGSTINLGGTNDVNNGNRGIMVENPEWGRVIVPWKRFQKLTFIDGQGSGPGRDSYLNSGPIVGTVHPKDGLPLHGHLVWDVDEGWRWDIFNGDLDGLEFNIPFPLIASMTPTGKETCRVVLRSGRVLDLSGTQDTGRENGGVLVFSSPEAEPVHLLWDEIQSVVLEP